LADEIKTHYVKRGYATADDIVLSTTARTRTVFRPGLHSGGVRGAIIRQKIGQDGSWKDVNEVNFTKVPADCGVAIELDTEATTRLFEKLTHLYRVQEQGVQYGDANFVVAKKEEVLIVDDSTKAQAIQEMLDQGYSQEFWKALTEKDPDLASRLAIAKIQLDREAVIDELEAALQSHREDEPFWHEFFSRNPWILQAVFSASVFILGDEVYLGGKLPLGRQGKGGVATDFLASDASTKSFSVVDIKTPSAGLVGPVYRGELGSGLPNESYSIHAELSGGIVQVRNQIAVAIDNFSHTLGLGFAGLNRVHPKGVLICGMLDSLDQRQQDSFNHFRQGLFSLTVITYDEVLRRLRILFGQESDGVLGSDGKGGSATVPQDDGIGAEAHEGDSQDIPF
jgi:hypothetical protein